MSPPPSSHPIPAIGAGRNCAATGKSNEPRRLACSIESSGFHNQEWFLTPYSTEGPLGAALRFLEPLVATISRQKERPSMAEPSSFSAAAGSVTPDSEPIGRVHAVSGSRASIGLLGSGGLHRSGATVGKFVKIHTARALLIGVITDLSVEVASREPGFCGTARVDLTGEICDRAGALRFRRGITEYPTI